MQAIKKYLKCIWWNKALLSSYILTIIGFFLIFYLSNIAYFCFVQFGFIILSLTKFGVDTLRTYNRLVNAHKNGHQIYVHSDCYCDKAAQKWFNYEYYGSK